MGEQKDANAILKQELNSVKSENKELKSKISTMKNEIETKDESIETLLKEKRELEKKRVSFQNKLAQKKNNSDKNSVAIIDNVKNVKHQKTVNLHSDSIFGLEIFEKRNIKYLVSASGDGKIKVWNLSEDFTNPILTISSNLSIDAIAYVEINEESFAACGGDKPY